jgi:hypothetical protein
MRNQVSPVKGGQETSASMYFFKLFMADLALADFLTCFGVTNSATMVPSSSSAFVSRSCDSKLISIKFPKARPEMSENDVSGAARGDVIVFLWYAQFLFEHIVRMMKIER